MLSKEKNRGFTFIETLGALFIVMIGIASFFTLINQTVSYTKTSSQQLVAAYLSKEGVEIVKNIRDTNFLIIHYTGSGDWTDGLTGCETGCQADYESTSLSPYADSILKIDGGFYKYSFSGNDTPYKRKITVVLLDSERLNVRSEVMWSERGRSHNLVAQEILYRWW